MSMSNMDSCSSPPPTSAQNWLGFSIPNHLHSAHHHHSSHLSLFHPFHNSPSQGTEIAVTRPQEHASAGSATDLSIFTGGGTKLEDFLGNRGTNSPSVTALPHKQLSQTEIYDSELKTIAASFLRGFSTDHNSNNNSNINTTQKQLSVVVPTENAPRKAVDTFGQRTSIYRGVTRHRWTGRYEAHLWDNSCRREGQSRKGRQVYLGGYDKEEKAARAYDLAALKYWGPTTTTNFPIFDYEKELEEMKHMTRQEFVASLRRKSSGFSRGASIYRGVTRHHQHGRWQARIGRVAGNKDLYLGTFSTQEEAAEAYDIAAIKFRGLNAVTNFDMSRYDVKSIMNSNLPIGGMSGKSKNSLDSVSENKNIDRSRSDDRDISLGSSITFASQPTSSTTLSFALPIKHDPSGSYWSNILGYQSHPSLNNAKTSCATIGQPLYQSSSTVHNNLPFSTDYSAGVTSVNERNNGVLNVTNCYIQPQQDGCSSIPFATPVADLNSNNSTYEGSAGYSSWASPPTLHAIPTVKPNLSVFQTPIFGME